MDAFPRDILAPATERWRRTGVTITGGIPTAGAPGIALTDGGGFWMAWMTDIALDTTEEHKTAARVDAYLDGGAQAIIVPAYTANRRPEFSAGSYALVAYVAEPAPLRATVIRVAHTGAARFSGGEYFSITHPAKGKRLYEVRGVDTFSATQTVEIRPPLRHSVTTDAIDLNNPGCVMRLANPDDWIGPLDSTHSAVANPIWIEDLNAG